MPTIFETADSVKQAQAIEAYEIQFQGAIASAKDAIANIQIISGLLKAAGDTDSVTVISAKIDAMSVSIAEVQTKADVAIVAPK